MGIRKLLMIPKIAESTDSCPLKGSKVAPEPCYVGVDFGTARSGWAYSTGVGDNDVYLLHNYPHQKNEAPKTPTMLLYERDNMGHWQPTAWGMDAHLKTLNSRGARSDCIWPLTYFKLWLIENNPDRVHLPPDFPYDAVTVVSHYLRFLLKHIVDNLRKKLGNDFSRENIRWCLTVPAKCSDAAKAGLRRAARLAGMVNDPLDSNLTLAHEPEAAALTVTVKNTDMKYKEGESFLIVDAGGGTVDITYHNVVKQGHRLVLSEATYRRGLDAGSVLINNKFVAFLYQLIGKDTILHWRKRHPDKWAMLEDQFESMKRGFDGFEDNYLQNHVTLHRTLREMMTPDALRALRYCQEDNDDDIQIPFERMLAFFNEPIDRIVDVVHEVLQSVPKLPDQMVLVGGLGSSPYLYERMREEFQEHKQAVKSIVQAECAYSAVVQGAVLHGRAPDTIYERRSLWTYGVEVMADWQPDAPDSDEVQGGRRVTRKLFSHFVKTNDVLRSEHKVVQTFHGTYEGQKQIDFPIFAADRSDVKYTTDPGVFKVGTVIIPIKSHKSRVDVEFKFGLGDIQVKAKEHKTKNKVSVTLQFTEHHPAQHVVGSRDIRESMGY